MLNHSSFLKYKAFIDRFACNYIVENQLKIKIFEKSYENIWRY